MATFSAGRQPFAGRGQARQLEADFSRVEDDFQENVNATLQRSEKKQQLCLLAHSLVWPAGIPSRPVPFHHSRPSHASRPTGQVAKHGVQVQQFLSSGFGRPLHYSIAGF